MSRRWKNRQCRSVHSIIGAMEKRYFMFSQSLARHASEDLPPSTQGRGRKRRFPITAGIGPKPLAPFDCKKSHHDKRNGRRNPSPAAIRTNSEQIAASPECILPFCHAEFHSRGARCSCACAARRLCKQVFKRAVRCKQVRASCRWPERCMRVGNDKRREVRNQSSRG